MSPSLLPAVYGTLNPSHWRVIRAVLLDEQALQLSEYRDDAYSMAADTRIEDTIEKYALQLAVVVVWIAFHISILTFGITPTPLALAKPMHHQED